MADVVTSQILENGRRRIVAKFTNFSDGTGENGVVKVDATSGGPYGVVFQGQTFYPGLHLKVVDMAYDVSDGMAVRVQWVASSAVDMWICRGNGAGPFVWLDSRAGFQGIVNPATAGATGSIQFTTAGQTTGASYSIMLTMIKGIPQT